MTLWYRAGRTGSGASWSSNRKQRLYSGIGGGVLREAAVVAWVMRSSTALMTICALMVVGVCVGQGGQDLARAREAAAAHRYQEALDILEPAAEDETLDPGTRFEVLAEVGRARFHLGRYKGAYNAFAAAMKLQPGSVEAALYFEASAWLTGRHREALGVFEALLTSGARDLYLAVTLPGEKQFLSDPEVWEVLQRHERPLAVDLKAGVALGAKLGQKKDVVLAVLPGSPPDSGRELAVRVGPHVLWALRFGSDDRLEEVLVDAENLLRYTPYRLHFASGLDWRMTSETARKILGDPVRESTLDDGSRVLTWTHEGVQSSLEFGPPRDPRPVVMPEGTWMLRFFRMVRTPKS